MPKLSALNKLREVKVEYDGEIVTIQYNPGVVNPEWEASYNDWAKSEVKSKPVVETLAAALVSWDIVNDDGSEFKPTAENLSKLAITFLTSVFTEILKVQSPNAPKSGS